MNGKIRDASVSKSLFLIWVELLKANVLKLMKSGEA